MLAHRRMVRDNGLSAVPFIRPLPRLALPCLALQCHATPRNALPRPAQSGCFRILPANVMRWRWDTKIVVSSFVAGLSRNPCCRPVAFPRLCSARRPLAACLHITSLTGLFRAFRAASCSAHRIATAFMPPKPASSAQGFPATFRLVCRVCSPSPGVVKILYTNVEHRVNKNLQKHKYEVKQ